MLPYPAHLHFCCVRLLPDAGLTSSTVTALPSAQASGGLWFFADPISVSALPALHLVFVPVTHDSGEKNKDDKQGRKNRSNLAFPKRRHRATRYEILSIIVLESNFLHFLFDSSCFNAWVRGPTNKYKHIFQFPNP